MTVLLAATAATLLWGRALWYFDQRSPAFRRWVFAALGRSRRTPDQTRAMLLSILYYGIGLVLALALMLAFGVRAEALFSFAPWHLGVVVLAVIGEISLSSFLIDVMRRVTRQSPARFAEIQEIPWIEGIHRLPAGMVPFAAAAGGVVEELVYRGVVLRLCTNVAGMSATQAILIAGALFCLQQLIQVRTPFQAMVIGCGCVAISLVGGLVVVLTGSVVPALIAHASFVVFFMSGNSEAPAAMRRANG